MAQADRTLGVILAGGRNRRYGSHKALAELGGTRIIDRVASALAAASARVVIVANEVEAYADSAEDVRPDVRPNLGALGGIHTALTWAAEADCDVALIVACDMPFVSPSLLRRLVEAADSGSAVLPASAGPRGLEPLCAAYGVGCIDAVTGAIDRGDRAVISFFGDVDLRVVDREEVARHGPLDHMFMNVNRPGDLLRAEDILASRAKPAEKTGEKDE